VSIFMIVILTDLFIYDIKWVNTELRPVRERDGEALRRTDPLPAEGALSPRSTRQTTKKVFGTHTHMLGGLWIGQLW
jgi:hypothetical protein